MPAVFLPGADVHAEPVVAVQQPAEAVVRRVELERQRSSFASSASRSRFRLPLSFGLAASFSARTRAEAL